MNVVDSESCHLCVPLIYRDIKHVKQAVKQVLFTCPLQENDDKANERKILKLHRQFAHPKPNKLIKFDQKVRSS